MHNPIWLVNINLSFCLIILQREFFNNKNSGVREELSYLPFFFWHNCNKSLWKNIFLVSSHSWTSPLVRAPNQLPLLPSTTTCVVDNFQSLRFGNIHSPNKFTGKPKIVSHPKSSQEILKQKSTFTFKLSTIYPSTRPMAQPYIRGRLEVF